MSSSIRRPTRIAEFSEENSYYPREMVEINGELYIFNSDGTTKTRLNPSAISTLVDADNVEIGKVDPAATKTITIPKAGSSKYGLVKLSDDAAKENTKTATAGTSEKVSRADHTHPAQTHVESADSFYENKEVKLTGDVTGSATSKGGWSVATTLADSGVTEGSYGTGLDSIPEGTKAISASVPFFNVSKKGTVTSAENKNIVFPGCATYVLNLINGYDYWYSSNDAAPFIQEVSIPELTGTEVAIVDVILSGDYEADSAAITAYSKIYRIVTESGKVKIYAYEIPETNVKIQLRIFSYKPELVGGEYNGILA